MQTSILKRILKILGINYIFQWFSSIKTFPSAILLILVNLIPLIGVIFLKWNAYDIIFLYWVESIVIGICNIPRIIIAHKTSNKLLNWATKNDKGFVLVTFLMNFFLAIFFVMHFGGFLAVQGVFLKQFFWTKTSFFLDNNLDGLKAFFIALLISHGYSLIANYILKKEYKNRTAEEAMMRPYKRVIVIQFTVIFGFVISYFFPNSLIILFILLKILIDLSLHLESHYNSIASNRKSILNSDQSINLKPEL